MTMTPEFTSGRRPRAADLNRLASEAASAHPGFNGFLAADNGAGLSLRSPRRDPSPRAHRAVDGGDPHLVVRIKDGSPHTADAAWTLAGDPVPVGSGALPHFFVYASDLAAGTDAAAGGSVVVAHRVAPALLRIRNVQQP